MPVIVPPEAFDLWLDCRATDALTAKTLIAPAPDDLLEAWPVSTLVNRIANDSAALIERLAPAAAVAAAPEKPPRRAKKAPPDDGQGLLF
jgi:hypothetical protein